jgi:hypothetical protein
VAISPLTNTIQVNEFAGINRKKGGQLLGSLVVFRTVTRFTVKSKRSGEKQHRKGSGELGK